MFGRWFAKKPPVPEEPNQASSALSPKPTGEGKSVALLLQIGLDHHQAGRLSNAEDLYGEVLAVEPNNFDALHLMGLAEHALGRSEQAAELVSRAVAVNPSNGMALANLAEI